MTLPEQAGEHIDGRTPLWDRGRLHSVHAQADKSDRVRRMFDSIAPTYELVNRVFSGGRDRSWRKKAVTLAEVRPNDSLLDVACGTGDLMRAFARGVVPPAQLLGADFSMGMLRRAKDTTSPGARWAQADGLALPFSGESFDIASCAFGVRNFQDLDRGLREMYRVLRDGGRAVILEFTRPPNRMFRMLHEFYSGKLMPMGARLVSRDRTGAYDYLPKSVASFIDAAQMCDCLRSAGFASVSATPLTFGVVTVYVAAKESR